jgi:hypothetical protein
VLIGAQHRGPMTSAHGKEALTPQELGEETLRVGDHGRIELLLETFQWLDGAFFKCRAILQDLGHVNTTRLDVNHCLVSIWPRQPHPSTVGVVAHDIIRVDILLRAEDALATELGNDELDFRDGACIPLVEVDDGLHLIDKRRLVRDVRHHSVPYIQTKVGLKE